MCTVENLDLRCNFRASKAIEVTILAPFRWTSLNWWFLNSTLMKFTSQYSVHVCCKNRKHFVWMYWWMQSQTHCTEHFTVRLVKLTLYSIFFSNYCPFLSTNCSLAVASFANNIFGWLLPEVARIGSRPPRDTDREQAVGNGWIFGWKFSNIYAK